ncbi:ABC transporter substrate-binding protein [Bradyrhizobium sp. 141]|uniref:ABC transporter substrate-binding protein n=1 Tax=Bradyrhizobium sp. 141 TaxID=2782617 RepID=UPI001FF9BFDB|nr:ABC transporter substrate-binding protein [Bradyrhizobium sp. 141]
MREKGWIEGKNLLVEYRFAEAPDRMPALAAELVALIPDLVIALGPSPALALKSATAAVPIVFVVVADPVGLGLVQSLSRPAGNIPGLASWVPGDWTAKQIQVLRELIPGATKIALLINPGNPIAAPSAARKLGVALPIVEATTDEDLDIAFASAAAQHADAIIVLGDVLIIRQAPRVIALAAKHRLPAMHFFRQFADGGLVVYGPDIFDLLRRGGNYVDKIVKGTKPSDLPVEQPTKFDFVINMKTAKALGLSVPTSLLLRADEVIE